MNEEVLGTEKVSKLVLRFAIPCVISMVVAALYNIVDQIFIGWSRAGAFGNAATNIVYPFTILALGIALLIGDGCAAQFSIALGEGEKEKANRNIGNGVSLLVISAIILGVIGFVFQTKILALFGGNPEEAECYGYAVDYYRIICMGVPFYIIGQGLNGSIRADGSPRYAMACTLAGAIVNLIGDPLLIFGMNMGVEGAAAATVAGQFVTFGMSVWYLFHSKNFKVSRHSAKIRWKITKNIITVGMASLVVQLSIVVIVAVNNNLISKYGYLTLASTGVPFGAVTPLAVVGIVMKVFGIVISIVIGISVGGQPIIGFNMGAGKIDRVRETITLIIKLVLLVGTIAFLLFELVPNHIINLFGNQNTPEYKEYAHLCMRIFLGGIILTCFIKSAAVMLQSMGNSTKSTFLALLRDVIIFVPASILLATLTQSVVAMLWAPIISDVISAITGFFFVRSEIRKIEKMQ